VETITRFALVQWRLTLLLVGLVLIGGAFTYVRQPSQEDPEVTIRTAVVTAAIPGMSAERIEQLLVKPIEEAVKQIPEVDEVRSSAEAGSAMLKIELLPAVTNVKPIWGDLRNKLEDLSPSLPRETIGPLVNDDYGRVAVTTLALTGSDFTMAELRGQARSLRDRLSALPLASRVDLYGLQDERVWLTFERGRLAQLGLNPQTVLDAIAEQNQILPSGALLTEEGARYTLEPSGAFRSVDAIGDVAVRTPSGALVYVRDLLQVERGYVDPPRHPVLFDGRRAVVIAVAMLPNVSIQEFGAQLDGALERLRVDLPLGMSLDLITHQPPIVASAVREATSNLGQTLLTVLVVVMPFLGLRAGSIVGTIVPLTICLTLVGMLVFEIPLHRVSIAAVIIALGLLVDNGVVITEDIKKRIDEGVQREEAALAASRALAVPLLTSSLTTVLAFLPLWLAPDATGEFLRALSQVIAITLLSSWLLAITVTPLLCVRFLPEGRADGASRANERLRDGYERILGGLLRARLPFLATMLALFAIASIGMARVPTGLLPPSARSQFVVKLELPAGTNEIETLRVAERLARWLADERINPEITSNVFYVGTGGPRFFLALSPLDPAPHIAFGVVNTAESKDVAHVRARFEEFLAAQLPEGRGWTELLFLGQEPPGTLEIRLSGDSLDRLYQEGRRIEALFASIPGTRDVRNDWANPVLQLDLLIDQERSRRARLSPTSIARALEASFDGVQITEYREGDRSIPVLLRARAEDRATLDDLNEVTVVADDGTAVPLLQVASLAGELTPFVIRRVDLERTLTVSGVSPQLSAAALLAALTPKLEAMVLPPGFHWVAGGEVEASARANAALFRYMPQCLVAIIVLLVWQFGSFRRTAIIVLTIPLIQIGASLGLNLLSATLDFNALLGLFALAGIIVNNAIVLIERIDEERQAGLAIDAALRAAGRARLRPILMTTLTTIVGLVPLCLLGGELWFAMTVVMMFGLGIGTLLTLGVVPVLYAVMFRAPRMR
jgi:multidrug efflux pump subunit AcrB